MSDSRYPTHGQVPHAQYGSHVYANSGLANGYSQRRPSAPYAQAQSNYPPSYPTNAYSVPQRSMTPSLAGHPQQGYPQSPSRNRTTSISTMPATSSGNYGSGQQPPMLGHHRTPSQLQSTQLDVAYLVPHAQGLAPNYVQPNSPPPSNAGDYYYGQTSTAQDGQSSASTQRPFPCDMCALSFNRQHDLKRHRDTHSGERPFLCNGGCGKTFTRKDALKRHQVSI